MRPTTYNGFCQFFAGNPDEIAGCAKCNYKGIIVTEDDKTAAQCFCLRAKMRVALWRNLGIPARWLAVTTDDVERMNMPNSVISRLSRGGGFWLQALCKNETMTLHEISTNKMRVIRALLCAGGDSAARTAYACVLLKAFALSGMFSEGDVRGAYIAFSAIKDTLCAFDQAAERSALRHTMTNAKMVVVDGIAPGKYGPAFESNWEGLVAARFNSGLPTLWLCEDGYQLLPGATWKQVLTSDDTLFMPFAAGITQTAQTAQTASREGVAQRPEITPAAHLTSDDEIEDAIITLLTGKPGRTRSVIYQAINADQDAIKARLEWLRDSGYVCERKAQGSKGMMVLYDVTEKSDTQGVSAASITKPMSLRSLAKSAGISHETVRRYRTEGLTDSQILETAGGNKG